MNNLETKEDSVSTLKKRAIIGICASAIIMGGAGFGIGYKVCFDNTNKTTYSKDFQTFLKYYEYFKDNYYTEQNERTLIDGLYYGLTSSVNDNYTFYVSNANNESQNLQTTQVGIGFERALYYGNAKITHVMSNSPASKAKFINSANEETGEVGLKDGDIITKVKELDVVSDYYVLKDNQYSEWSSHFQGERGTDVEIVILRDGVEKRCIVTRDTFDSDKVRLVEKNYTSTKKEAVVKISSFLGNERLNETTPARELIDLFTGDLLANNEVIDNLILDFRGNGGGYVNNCSELLSLFVGKQNVYGYYYYPRENKYSPVDGAASIFTYTGWKNFNSNINHFTLIIDENSASATESFVLGMKDFDETKEKVSIVGEISYGKGIAQSFMYPYSSEYDYVSSIRYTSAQVVSVKKNSINKRGIVPNVMVDATYRSIQDADEYDYYRKEVTSITDPKDQAIVVARIEALLCKKVSTNIVDVIKAYQTEKKMTIDGEFTKEVANSLNDDFYNYYLNNKPINTYAAFIQGSDDIDGFSSAQRKYVKRQIEAVTGNTYTNFYSACKDFQTIYASELGTQSEVYNLATSYYLYGKIVDIKMGYQQNVLEVAKQ